MMDESQIERPFSSRFVVIFTVPRLLAALADHDVALTPRRLAQTRQLTQRMLKNYRVEPYLRNLRLR